MKDICSKYLQLLLTYYLSPSTRYIYQQQCFLRQSISFVR